MTQPAPNTPADLAVRLDDGSVGSMPAADANAAIARGEAKPATSDEYEAARTQHLQANAGFLDQAAGLTFGGIRGFGATLGLPVDKTAIDTARFLGGEHAAETTRHVLQDVSNAAPTASKVGEFAGVAAPALVGDEEGSAMGLAGEGGEGIGEALAQRFLPNAEKEGASFLERAGAKALKSSGRNAAEAAQLGVVDAQNEASIENKPLTAEQTFVSGLQSGVAGGVLGGLLGAGGEGLGTASKAIREAIGGKSVEAAGSLSGSLASAAEDRYIAHLSPSQDVKFSREIDSLPGGRHAAARAAMEEASPEVGDTVTHSAEKLRARSDFHNEAVGNTIDEATKVAGDHAGPNRTDVADAIETQLKKPLMDAPELNRAEINHVDAILNTVRGSGEAHENMSFRELFNLRRTVGGKVGTWKITPGGKETHAVYKQAYGILDGALEKSLDDAADKYGNTLGADFRASKLKSRQFRVMANAAERGAEKEGSQQNFSLGTKVLASHGGLSGLLMGGAHHIATKYGNVAAAVTLDKAARMATIQRASSSVADDVTTGLQKFFAGEMKAEALPRLTPQAIDNIQAHLSDPAAQAKGLQQHLGNMPNFAPQLAQQVALTHSRAVSYLAANIPKPLATANSMQPQLQKKRYAPQDLTRFARIHQVVADPAIVPKLLGTGQLTHDHVTALKEVYPAIYSEIQNLVQQKVSTSKKAYSYSQRCALSLLFDEPLDATMNPAFIQDVQASYAANPEPPSPGAKAPKRPLKLTGASVSGSEG